MPNLPSTTARDIAEHIRWELLGPGDKSILGEKLVSKVSAALAEAKREGMEEAARLAEYVDEYGCQSLACTHEYGESVCIAATIRAAKEKP